MSTFKASSPGASVVLNVYLQAFSFNLVREGGVEPPRVSSRDPKSRASANSATLALALVLANQSLAAKWLSFKNIALVGPGKALGRRPCGRLAGPDHLGNPGDHLVTPEGGHEIGPLHQVAGLEQELAAHLDAHLD